MRGRKKFQVKLLGEWSQERWVPNGSFLAEKR